LEKKDPKSRGVDCVNNEEFDLMVKMSKLVQKFKNPFFEDNVPEKMVKQITFPK
jgi:hypothetical protein